MGTVEEINAASTELVGERAEIEKVGGFTLVKGDPDKLKPEGVTLDEYALARMIASEEGSGPAVYWLAVGEAARNEAMRRKIGVAELLLRSTMPAANGRFSEQAAGKWASTRRDPNQRHLAAAKAVLGGSQFTNGARDFFSPAGQDKGVQGDHKLRLTSEQYIQRQADRALEWVGPIEGIDAYRLMLFRDGAQPVGTRQALDELARARQERKRKGAGTLVVLAALGWWALSSAAVVLT